MGDFYVFGLNKTGKQRIMKVVIPMNKRSVDFQPYLEEALNDLGFKEFSSIQLAVFKEALKGQSVIGQSQTGSGKTHAFLLPIFERLDLNKKEVQAVIIAPTKELAMQINRMAEHLASFSPKDIDIRLYVGGTDRDREIERLNHSQPHIVIGTPGKVKDLSLDANALLIYTANTMVVDEVDMAFEIGFLEEIDLIAQRLQKPQILLFSATLPEAVMPFVKKYLGQKTVLHTGTHALKITHILLPIKSKEKLDVLSDILPILNPYLALIFANTKERVEMVVSNLMEKGFRVAMLHGGLSTRERKRLLNEIHDLKYQYIVASDIAARGIDIEGISHVINYDLPSDPSFYIHRSGRTGRVNLSGVCVSFYDFDDDKYLEAITKRGVVFEYRRLKNGELTTLSRQSNRQTREKPLSEIEKAAHRKVKKSSDVKPGYKKKRAEEIKKVKKQLYHESLRRGGKK